ncbi:MAG: hypothetical protein CMH26_08265 [Micavibrio sp.]|nr:hypothetical protein [Micavibrio sp.]|tara:strand:+ start:450 stop:911 length:462 start_codon:yes stop_codon:yes gene_type:complete
MTNRSTPKENTRNNYLTSFVEATKLTPDVTDTLGLIADKMVERLSSKSSLHRDDHQKVALKTTFDKNSFFTLRALQIVNSYIEAEDSTYRENYPGFTEAIQGKTGSELAATLATKHIAINITDKEKDALNKAIEALNKNANTVALPAPTAAPV